MGGNDATMDAASIKGEEFRDDRRRRKGLPPEILKRLTKTNAKQAWRGVAETALILAAAVGVAIYWWTPWAVIPAIVVIAARQQACFVLAHDAAHYRLFESRHLNDAVGCFMGTIVGISMRTYRVIHRLHHNHLYEPQDPDIPLNGGYPRGRAYLLKKLARDLVGFTAYKTYSYFFGAPTINDEAEGATRPLHDTSPALRHAARRDRWTVAGFHIAAPIIAFAAGYGVEYLVLWVLPLATALQAILRFRAVLEHGAVTDFSSPLTAARTNITPWWLRWWLFPHNVNYHVEHHLYPSVPFYNLPECHQEMRTHGVLDGAEVRNVFDTVRTISA